MRFGAAVKAKGLEEIQKGFCTEYIRKCFLNIFLVGARLSIKSMASFVCVQYLAEGRWGSGE